MVPFATLVSWIVETRVIRAFYGKECGSWCNGRVHFAYNYAYLRVYIPKIHIPNSYIPKIFIPKIYIPGIHIPNIYIPRLHIYTQFFTYSRYTCQKNIIPRVYIPPFMSTRYVKIIHTSKYVQNITYFVRIEHGAQAPWCPGYLGLILYIPGCMYSYV
jgi:hypothetical protein